MIKMMIEVESNNSSFAICPEAEAVDILRALATRIKYGQPKGIPITYPLSDINGNSIGKAVIEMEEEVIEEGSE